MCAQGTSKQWPAVMGLVSRKATCSSSRHTTCAGSTPAMTRQKMQPHRATPSASGCTVSHLRPGGNAASRIISPRSGRRCRSRRELVAKPVIDIMAGVATLDDSRNALPVLAGVGYLYFPYRAEVMHWLCKPSEAFRTHHLHLVPADSQLWRERLLFRDRLRQDAALAEEYGALKLRLGELHRFDREAYTDAKGPFVRRALQSIAAAETP